MNQIIALMIAQAIQSNQALTVNNFGQPCEQVALYQCIPLVSGNEGSLAPTSSVAAPARIFINTPAPYSLWQKEYWDR
jgi:hypothetical protein